jgi:hypothetical protein
MSNTTSSYVKRGYLWAAQLLSEILWHPTGSLTATPTEAAAAAASAASAPNSGRRWSYWVLPALVGYFIATRLRHLGTHEHQVQSESKYQTLVAQLKSVEMIRGQPQETAYDVYQKMLNR